MTLREIGDWIVETALYAFETMTTESFFDWQLWMLPLAVLVAFAAMMAFGLIGVAIILGFNGFFGTHEVEEGGARRARRGYTLVAMKIGRGLVGLPLALARLMLGLLFAAACLVAAAIALMAAWSLIDPEWSDPVWMSLVALVVSAGAGCVLLRVHQVWDPLGVRE